MTTKLPTPLFLLLIVSTFSYSQNIGIGTNSPTEKLDINGNVNLNGALKVNNNAGKPGQVLMKSNGNNLVWGDPSVNGTNGNSFGGYRHNFTVTKSGAGTFTVPEGDSTLLIEMWGAGGAGAISTATEIICYDPEGNCGNVPVYSLKLGGGGGGGGYLRAMLNVKAGQTLSYYVGAGGNGNGDSSVLNIMGTTLVAEGGRRGDTSRYNIHSMPNTMTNLGLGGGFRGPSSVNNNINYVIGMNGENGTPTTTISYVSSYDESNINFGGGGNAGNSMNTGGSGGFLHIGFTYLADQVWPNYQVISGIPARQPGGGGASNPSLQSGGNGIITFWW